MSTEELASEQEIISDIQKFVHDKEVSNETANLIAKLSFGFAKQIAFDLNSLLETKDVQTNDLKEILRNNDFDEIADAVGKHLSDVLIAKKEANFAALKKMDYVSKNYHFEFARQLLASKHKESILAPTNEYSDDDI